jgi:hypothetical protein
MKDMANALRNLDEPVADHTLVLILRGLKKKYDHLKT